MRHCVGWWHERNHFERSVIVLWMIALVGIIIRLLVLPDNHRTLFPIYHDAGRHWIAGVDLYPKETQGSGFPLYRYSPTAAVAFTPFSPAPRKLADVFWRLINATALLGGALWAARALAPRPLTREQLTLLFVLLFPPALGHLSNGQCNALVIGLILCSFAAVRQRHWSLGAGLLAAATLFKVYSIAPGLLLAVVHPRRFGSRFLLALLVGLAVPFACQRPEYVLNQYRLWIGYALNENRSVWRLANTNLDFQLLLRVCGCPISLNGYRLIEVLVGLAFAAVCLAAARQGRPEHRTLTLALGLGCVWMTVFGPATESPTYLLLAPPLALSLIDVCAGCAVGRGVRGLLIASYAIFLSVQMSAWVSPLFSAYRIMAPQPIAGLLFMTALLLHEWNRSTAPLELPSEMPAAAA